MKSFLSILLLAVLCSNLNVSAQNTCNGVWGQYLVNQTFGEGNATDTWYGPLATYAPGASTSTTFVGAAGPVGGVLTDGYSGLAKVPSASNQGNWIATTDHTGDPNGLMMLINAPSTAATVFFEYTMDNLCPNTTLKLAVWILNVNDPSLTSNPTYQYPNMTLNAIDPATGTVLGTAESGNVAADEMWHQYSVVFNNGNATSIKLQLVNNSVGSGFGNDLALDDITIQPCTPESHILPKLDTTICQNALLHFTTNVINSPYSPAEYQWQYSGDNGATWLDQGAAGTNTNYTFDPSSLPVGTYLIRYKTGPLGSTANYNCVAVSDTSIINILSAPQVSITESRCLGEVYDFYGHYVGLTGTYDTLIYSGPTDVCGSHITLHFTAKPLPDVNIAGPSSIDLCTGDTILLKSVDPLAGTVFQWIKDGASLPGETGPTYFAAQGGDYILAGTLNGCVDTSKRLQIALRPTPIATIINSNALLCSFDTLIFKAAQPDPNAVYMWTPERDFRILTGAEGPLVYGLFDQTTLITLNVYSAYGCSAQDTATAFVQPCCQVFVPSAFSPNGDGLNDFFTPAMEPGQIMTAFKIFDRYGKMVYNNSDPKKGWNGNYMNGQLANLGVYMYRVQYTCSDNKLYEKKGDITLIR
jgi:gliding motility-associated-like protein